jgi:beta-N-acetylhexosaminidase
VAADSHIDIPYDERALSTIKAIDLQIFSKLASRLSAVMPAHVIYSQVDSQPAGFSKLWLQQILRQELEFDGVIFSDDLSMKGAEVAGEFCNRAQLALEAGCDMILVCNNPEAAMQVVEYLQQSQTYINPVSSQRLKKLQMQSQAMGLIGLKQTERWQYLSERLSVFNQYF